VEYDRYELISVAAGFAFSMVLAHDNNVFIWGRAAEGIKSN
jgi:alpha-tubulin suppressor-like RCC1 family protein